MTRAEHLQSPLLSAAGFRHAFFTRRGGVSKPPFDSLNFSVTVGDTNESVDENLRRAAEVLEITPEHLYFASQVHGSNARVITAHDDRREVLQCEADAIVSESAGIGCGVRSADCVPILVADPASGAVTAIHAGWRGVVGRAVHAGVERLRNALGTRGDLMAAIGPHLSVAHFEVDPDVAETLRHASSDPEVVDESRAKPHVDLRRVVRAQLRDLGLVDDAIDDVVGCTYADRERFFSYRRDGARTGRHLSVIVARAS